LFSIYYSLTSITYVILQLSLLETVSFFQGFRFLAFLMKGYLCSIIYHFIFTPLIGISRIQYVSIFRKNDERLFKKSLSEVSAKTSVVLNICYIHVMRKLGLLTL